MNPEKREKIKRAAHILAAMVILLHAFHKHEEHHSTYIWFLIFGLLFLGLAIFHHTLKSKYPWIDTLFFGIEGVLSLIISLENFDANKIALGSTYLFAASLQLVSIWIFSKRLKKSL